MIGRARLRRWVLVVAAIAVAACDEGGQEGSVEHAEAHDLGAQECAACGMIVREQPSPRGQLVHRDGHRAWFCSIADMLTYLEAPSPHGSAAAVFAEAMPPDADDPVARSTDPRPWIAAEEASFVHGFERERIMGEPFLVYRRRADAEEVARELDARVSAWEALRQGSSGAAGSAKD